jgi:hypothetical protein
LGLRLDLPGLFQFGHPYEMTVEKLYRHFGWKISQATASSSRERMDDIVIQK